MKKRKRVAVVAFTGWRLRNLNTLKGRSWKVVRKAGQPPVGMEWITQTPDSLVSEPHPQRTVFIVRYGKKMMDTDKLYASVKPVLDRIKAKKVKIGDRAIVAPGLIYDDSPRYCKLEVFQDVGEYAVEVSVFQ